jgi:hypothetical protein
MSPQTATIRGGDRPSGRPERTEAAPYYFRYIDRIASDDVVGVLESQSEEASAFFVGISEEKSLRRYEPGKWSIREVLSHVNDSERVFSFRALWFARGFDDPLPSFDQDVSARGARADELSWSAQCDDFRAVRRSTVTLFRNLPAEAWMRGGVASGNPFTVRALAYAVAGHLAHHRVVIQERYL